MNKNFTVIKLSSLDPKSQSTMFKYVYNELKDLEKEYKGFSHWYKSKIIGDNRDIIITLYENKIAGIAILKRGLEKKICTLRVIDHFQGMGLGKSLMEMSFDYLNTDKPLITVSSLRSQQFKNLFNYYNFKQEGLYQHKYNDKFNELTFNGILIEKDSPIQGNLFTEDNLLDLAKQVKQKNILNLSDYLISTENVTLDHQFTQHLLDYDSLKSL